MKRTSENRYQHSATLFKFCKEALEIRYEGNVKVIDQDVGAILGYDPADCSHWKKGKKNIRALSTLRSIADHLSIDERLLIDIAFGRVGLEEAIFEYKGYGKFALKGPALEGLKKEYFKNPGKWRHENGSNSNFEELFDIDRQHVAGVVDKILQAGKFSEAPIYLPEVCLLFPEVTLEKVDQLNTAFEAKYTGEGTSIQLHLKFRGPEMRPYMRFLLAKELFKFMVYRQHSFVSHLKKAPEEVVEIQSNIFAGMLLVPKTILRKEVERVDSALDIIQQLAGIFWVSKSLMNQRLGDYMENLN